MLKILTWIGGKLLAQKTNFNPLIMIGAVMMIVIMIPIAIFNPGSSGGSDPYIDAYREIGCGSETEYILEDIRAFESFVDPTSYEGISKEEAKSRLQSIYINVVKENATTSKKCLLKSDDEIKKALSTKYTISEKQMVEMMQDVSAVRNGRLYLTMPFDGLQVGIFDKDKGKNGILIKAEEQKEVLASADGIVKNIYTSNKKLPYKDPSCIEDCSSTITQGLTLVIEYTIQKGLNVSGEYNIETVLVTYSLVKNITLNVGDKITQGERIASTDKESVYLELTNPEGAFLDPNNYIFMEKQAATLTLPFDLPIPISSEMGDRNLAGAANTHYGLDMDKGEDAPIKAIADGTIFAINSSCAPYGGKLGSTCPEINPVTGGGNYVQVKFEHEGFTYYATYMHMAKVDVHKGDAVYAGDIIGTQGHSGNSSASHLHLEIHKDTPSVSIKEGLINPKDMLRFEKSE